MRSVPVPYADFGDPNFAAIPGDSSGHRFNLADVNFS